jgi:heterodisulfide reductase subunit C2
MGNNSDLFSEMLIRMNTSLKNDISGITGIRVDSCYQCGKCSAGCPLSAEMDFPPSYLMRMLQTGDTALQDKALGSFTIWVCLSCETCYSRCPMSIDIPKLMDYLRERSVKESKSSPRAKEIIAFHRSFLKSIEMTGRLYEVGLLVHYKLHTFKLMQDMDLAPAMLAKGKLNIFPEVISDRKKLSSIFSKTLKKRNNPWH